MPRPGSVQQLVARVNRNKNKAPPNSGDARAQPGGHNETPVPQATITQNDQHPALTSDEIINEAIDDSGHPTEAAPIGERLGPARTPPLESNVVASSMIPWDANPTNSIYIRGTHEVKRQATATAWSTLLPTLVYPLMQWYSRKARNSAVDVPPTCRCGKMKQATVNVISFNSILKRSIIYCSSTARGPGCLSPGVALLHWGVFTSRPIRPPKWAFDLDFLQHMSIHFRFGVPDVSAWCNSTVAFLSECEVKEVPSATALFQPLQSALQHYEITRDRIHHFARNIIVALASQSTKMPPTGPNHGLNPLTPPPGAETLSPQPSAPGGSPVLLNHEGCLPSSVVQEQCRNENWVTHCGSPADHEPQGNAPSRYLQSSCVACFPPRIPTTIPSGNFSGFHAIACLDANFEQKRLRHAGRGDQMVPKSQTYFLTREELAETKKHVDKARGGKAWMESGGQLEADDDDLVPGLSLPNYVYRGCTNRFYAAKEDNKKAESSVFEDTGLMALTCRHDRVLFMVTLTDAGEKQYNALALINRLFKGLPSVWRMGMLYDIGCKLDHSIQKHNLIPSYSTRIGWGVSVFHSFGHEIPCQMVYHPHKRLGFGFTDGEGCERVWCRLMLLIAVLRVSGYHRRLYILDQQLAHINGSNLMTLGRWWMQKMNSMLHKLADAEVELKQCGETLSSIQAQWKLQKDNVLRRIPKASKADAASFGNSIIAMQDTLSKTQNLINLIRANPDHAVSTVLSVDELTITMQRLRQRISANLVTLTGRDGGTAAVVRSALSDNFLGQRLQLRAILTGIRARVNNSLLEAVPYRRRISRVKRDMKIRTQTENSIARRAPAIKVQAKRYNALCSKLHSHPNAPLHPQLKPILLDISKLFDPASNQHMWMETGLLDGASGAPERYEYDENVKAGISAMLQISRAVEEKKRLGAELKSMMMWTKSSLKEIDAAVPLCQDEALKYQLKCRRRYIIELALRWKKDTKLAKNINFWWPEELERLQPQAHNEEEDEDEFDGGPEVSDVSALEDDESQSLLVDDRHAQFLEEIWHQEEDEVERMVTRIDGISADLDIDKEEEG